MRPGVTVIGNKIFVFGGSGRAHRVEALSPMEVYDPETNKWLGKKEMEVRSSWMGCVTLNIRKRMLSKASADKKTGENDCAARAKGTQRQRTTKDHP